MAARPRNRAGMDAEAVARMMAAQDADPEPEITTEPEAAPGAISAPVEPAPAEAPPITTMAAPEPERDATPEADTGPGAAPPVEPETFDAGKVDGRTLRRTGREPFATRIKPEAHAALRRIAYARQITMAEALELAVAAYEKRHKSEVRKPAA